MQRAYRLFAMTMVLTVLSAGGWGTAFAEITGKGSQVSIRFPAFSLSPGEKISGVKVTTSGGSISSGCGPSRWSCDHAERTIHCYSRHPSYATALSALLPEIFIRNAPGSFSITATVDLIDDSGREYTREFRESDLIVK